MPLTINDLQMAAWSSISGATGNDKLSGVDARIMAVHIFHTAAASIGIEDAATFGTAQFEVGIGSTGGNATVYLGPGGFRIRTGLSTSLTAGTAYIFYVSDPA